MKTFRIYGTGCAKCNALYENTRAAVNALGLKAQILKITDISQFAQAGVIFTPALADDTTLLVSGRVPTVAEISALLSATSSHGTHSSSSSSGGSLPAVN